MANFKLKTETVKTVGIVNFEDINDYKVIDLNGERIIVHKVLADKLIVKKLATLAKDQTIQEGIEPVTVTKLDE